MKIVLQLFLIFKWNFVRTFYSFRWRRALRVDVDFVMDQQNDILRYHFQIKAAKAWILFGTTKKVSLKQEQERKMRKQLNLPYRYNYVAVVSRVALSIRKYPISCDVNRAVLQDVGLNSGILNYVLALELRWKKTNWWNWSEERIPKKKN